MSNYLEPILTPVITALSITLALAALTLVERKILGQLQERVGPNIAHPHGILQPIADAIKLFTKEPTRPHNTSPTLFTMAPLLAFTLALLLWIPLPMPFPLADLNLTLLFLLAISSMMAYSILSSGWASNSSYALMSSVRAVAQTVSYEVNLGLIILSMIILSGAYSMQTFSEAQENIWLLLPTWPLAIMWYTSTLAETNRAPFDLAEGESELVSGYNIEYAAGHFALFFLAEYANILLMNTLSAIIFFGAMTPHNLPQVSSSILMLKVAILSTTFLWIRSSYPRFRYDKLMYLVWKNLLPMTLAFLLLHCTIPVAFAGLPP